MRDILESDIMGRCIMKAVGILLCAKSVGMTLGGNLHRDNI